MWIDIIYKIFQSANKIQSELKGELIMLTDRIIGAFTFRKGIYAEVEKDASFTYPGRSG